MTDGIYLFIDLFIFVIFVVMTLCFVKIAASAVNDAVLTNMKRSSIKIIKYQHLQK